MGKYRIVFITFSIELKAFCKTFKVIISQAYDAGDYFPVWGTCQGFQLLATITAKQDVMSNYDAEDLPLPLNFTKGRAYI